MHFTKLVPSIFYADIQDGLKLFVACLQFTITHAELQGAQPYCVLEKDGVSLLLFENKQLADEHQPELRLVTENIDEVYAAVVQSHSHLLHPNLSKVTLRPWGAREFAIMDHQTGIRFQQWK